MTDRYAVFGDPVAHSKSPEIHARFAEQTGEALVYDAVRVPRGRFEQALAEFRDGGGRGLNVTVPHKEAAWRATPVRTPRAERAGAVNTVWFEADGTPGGDNTDGVGLVRDLVVNHGLRLAGVRILLLGAGGAARGVLGPLLDALPAELVVANRTVARARALAGSLAGEGARGAPVRGIGLDDLAAEGQFGLVVNATAAGLAGEVPPLPPAALSGQACCYDLVYGDAPTPFVAWARAHGVRLALDGLGMLVEQAAESFLRWRGKRPQTAPVIAALRAGAG